MYHDIWNITTIFRNFEPAHDGGEIMKNPVKSYIAYFLLLCITVSIIPLNLFHHHESAEIICVNPESAEEQNPCHQVVFHSSNLQDVQCDHPMHLDREVEHCEFCELLTTRHNTYPPTIFDWITPIFQYGEEQTYISSHTLHTDSSVVFNRGPPA